MFTKLFGTEKLGVRKKEGGGYFIGNNIVDKIETIGCNIDDILLLEFEKSNLKWLLTARYKADKIVFIGLNKVDTFIGEWFDITMISCFANLNHYRSFHHLFRANHYRSFTGDHKGAPLHRLYTRSQRLRSLPLS